MKTFWDAFWMSFSLLCAPLLWEERKGDGSVRDLLRCSFLVCSLAASRSCCAALLPSLSRAWGQDPPLPPAHGNAHPYHVLVLRWG